MHPIAYHELPLGDRLALERTKLASRRTLLAYFRTSLAFLTAGGGMSEFLSGALFQTISAGLVAVAALISVWGIFSFLRTESKWRGLFCEK